MYIHTPAFFLDAFFDSSEIEGSLTFFLHLEFYFLSMSECEIWIVAANEKKTEEEEE